MPQAWPLALREQMVQRHQQGEPLTVIADALKVPYRTVRRWWHRYQQEGMEGLHTRYARCGPTGPKAPPAVPAAALELKREHPSWGAGLIRLQLVEQFAPSEVPQVRAIQRRFVKNAIVRPRADSPVVYLSNKRHTLREC